MRLLSDLECPEAELSILLTDDSEIKELNNQYRGKDKATDVLSFAQEGGTPTAGMILGDVVISLPTLFRQADELEVEPEEEMLRLLIHGTLHLLGYDHENVSPEEKRRMEAKEAELLEGFYP